VFDRVGIEQAPPGLWRRFWRRLHEPYPEPDHNRALIRRLNPRSGEQIQRVVPKHLIVYLPVPIAVGALALCLGVALFHWNALTILLIWLSLAAVVVTVCRAFLVWRDVFVLTNWRVVRLSGFFTTRVATMPINRILDMTMTRPPLGRVLGYGHFVFESAAQEQGLREIRFVPDILTIDHEINNAVNKEHRRRASMGLPPDHRATGLPPDVETTDPIPGLGPL